MGRKLDNWSFGLSLVGVIAGIIVYFLSPFSLAGIFADEGYIMVLLYILSISQIIFLLCIFGGFIVGIVALTKKPQKKWKPILAICIFTIFVIYLLSNILSPSPYFYRGV